MRRTSQLRLAAWLLASACSEHDAAPMADVAELCGQAGPVQILPLARDEIVSEDTDVGRFEDRWLYVVRQFQYPILDVAEAESPSRPPGVAQLDARVESIGHCGEDRRVVAQHIDYILTRHAETEAWFGGRSDTDELFWIDPAGRWAPRLVGEVDRGAMVLAGEDEIVVFRKDEGDVLHGTLAGDSVEVVTLATDVIDVGPRAWQRAFTSPFPTTLMVHHSDQTLVSIDLSTRRTTAVAGAVVGFSIDATERWLVVSTDTPEDPDAPPPEQWLMDRTTGERWTIGGGDDSWPDSSFGAELLKLGRSVDNPDASPVGSPSAYQSRFMVFPSRASIVLDGDWSVLGTTPTGRFAVVLSDGDGSEAPVYVFGLVDGVLQALAQPIAAASTYAGLVELDCAVDPDDGSSIPPCDRYGYSLDTLRRELLGRRQWSEIALPGDRWLDHELPTNAPNTLEPETRAKLWVIDGATGDRSLLDHHVSYGFGGLERFEVGARGVIETDEIVYQVRETDTDRNGLWRARFE